MIPNDDWDKIKYDLTQKLGEPQSEAPTVIRMALARNGSTGEVFGSKGMLSLPLASKSNISVTRPSRTRSQTSPTRKARTRLKKSD
jgi:hypothetical protein